MEHLLLKSFSTKIQIHISYTENIDLFAQHDLCQPVFKEEYYYSLNSAPPNINPNLNGFTKSYLLIKIRLPQIIMHQLYSSANSNQLVTEVLMFHSPQYYKYRISGMFASFVKSSFLPAFVKNSCLSIRELQAHQSLVRESLSQRASSASNSQYKYSIQVGTKFLVQYFGTVLFPCICSNYIVSILLGLEFK